MLHMLQKVENLKGLGQVSIDKIKVASGMIDIHIPIEVMSKDLDEYVDKIVDNFKKYHPQSKLISVDTRLTLSFGTLNPDFEMSIVIFDEENEENVEFYDCCAFGIELKDEQKRQIKQMILDQLSESMFNI